MSFGADLRKNPFGRLLFFYLSGIIGGSQLHINSPYIYWILALLLVPFTLLLVYFSIRRDFHSDRNSGIAAACIFIAAGLLSYQLYGMHCMKIKQTSGFHGMACLRILEPSAPTQKMVKCFADIENVSGIKGAYLARQKILVYFERDSASLCLIPGNRVKALISLTEIPGPKNPDDFDYRNYLASKRIINQTFIRAGDWEAMNENALSIKALSFRLQKALLIKFQAIGLSPTLYGILSAITLGYKNELDLHTRQAFSKAGVMHVMALSGFNVAVIAFALNYLLFFTNRLKYGNYVRLTAIILFIWFFAFITGFSSSVTRASLMISLTLAGKEFHRQTNVKNILYASAFILLALQPALIYDISFQLSFAAVFGIIVFHPYLEKTIHFRSRLFKTIWQLFTVSLAAQLATMPLTIATFHQFPVYFWITNLYVVPLVSVIICVSMILLLVSFLEPLMLVMGKILGILLAVLYESICMVEFMPFAVINDIRLSSAQLWLMISILLVLAMYLSYRKYILIIAGSVLVMTLQVTGIINKNKLDHQHLLMVGYLKNTTFINIIEGRNSIVLSSATPESPPVSYSFGNFWVNRGVNRMNINYKIPSGDNMSFCFAGQQIQISNSSVYIPGTVQPDILIITGKASPDSGYLSRTAPSQVILDSSVPKSKALKWIKICNDMTIAHHNVNAQGAWAVEMRRSFTVRPGQFLAGQ